MATRKRLPLDMYDDIPTEMRKYLRFHGWHFNKKACDFAVSLMRKKNASTDIWEFFNSFAHEVDHIEKHIAKTLNFSPYSESASYLVGEIIRNMFYNITRKMLC